MHIRLIDVNSLGYAQHHGQPLRHDEASNPVQAVYGVLWHIRQLLINQPNVLYVFVWDGRAQWRYNLHPEYKSGRHRTPAQQVSRQEYQRQQPWIQKALRTLPVLQIRHPGAEADDLGYGLSRQLSRQGHLVTLSTLDSDWLQSVSQRVRWHNLKAPYQLVELDGFIKSSGGYPTPNMVPPVKALAGDSSDDIAGVPNIADKRALGLLSKYQTLDNLLAASEEFLEFSSEPSYAHALMTPEIRELVRRNLTLVDLSKGPALAGCDCELIVGDGDELGLYEVFVDLGFTQFKDQFEPWRRLCRKSIGLGEAHAIERALLELPQSWD
jgi:DNA polymerase I